MRLQSVMSRMLCGAGLVLALASVAEAQATRTWVSGVGDDANPCSRTAPCKTWAGAISKTATGGYMNAVDPGGFGALTVTKNITVDGGPFKAGTLASGTSGIIISGAGIKVVLRNIDIEGINSLSTNHGINVITAASVTVEHVHIMGFGGNGINFNPSGGGPNNLLVNNVSIRHNQNVSVGNGILVQNGRATINNSRLESNSRGILANAGGIVTVRDTHIASNTEGVASFSVSGVVNIENCLITHNSFGINAAGGATFRVSNTGILSNTTGILNSGSTVQSLSGNTLEGNPTPGAFTGLAIPKQ